MSVTDTWADWKTDDTNKPSGLDSPEIDDELRNIKKQVKTNCLDTATYTEAMTNVLAAEGIRSYASLPAALTAIGTSSTTLLVDTAVAVSTNATIPSTLAVSVTKPGIFNISSGVTLTINGPFDAGMNQVFACTGTGNVVFGENAVDGVRPEWFGENTTPKTTVMTTALQKAIDSLPVAGRLILTNEYLTGPLNVTQSITIDGRRFSDLGGDTAILGSSLLAAGDQTHVLSIAGTATNDMVLGVYINNVAISGNSKIISVAALITDYVSTAVFNDIKIFYVKGVGWQMTELWEARINNPTINFCGDPDDYVIYLRGGVNNVRFTGGQYENLTGNYFKSVTLNALNSGDIQITGGSFEHGGTAWQGGNTSPVSVFNFTDSGTNLVITQNQISHYGSSALYDDYDTIFQCSATDGYDFSNNQLYNLTCNLVKVSGTASGIVRENFSSGVGAAAITLSNTSTKANRFHRPIIFPWNASSIDKTYNTYNFIGSNHCGHNTAAFVADAGSVSIEKTVYKTTTANAPMGWINLTPFAHYPGVVRIHARVKSENGSGSANFYVGETAYGLKESIAATWDTIYWDIPAADMEASITGRIICGDYTAGLYFDGFIVEMRATA